ncbi:hypothetical protein C7U77_28055 [Escherichia coli]|nr:hypothetical protein C7U77_28055 [Escherichia coli]
MISPACNGHQAVWLIFIASSSREQTTASDGKMGTTGYSGNLAEEAYVTDLLLIHTSEPTRLRRTPYAASSWKKKTT